MTNSLIAKRNAFATAHREQMVDLDGRNWGVLEVGAAGPPLLLLPGTLGRADIFWQQIESLSGRACIVALTYPASFDLDQWSDDITRLLDDRNIDRVCVLGSSLGGYVAQYFSAKHPDRCQGLIAANTLSSVAPLAAMPPYNGQLGETPIEVLRKGFSSGLNAWAAAHPDQSELVELLLAESDGRIEGEYLRARLMALKHAPDLPDCPLAPSDIAVIEAADDPLIAQPMREGVRRHLHPGVTYRFDHGGHFPYIVRPDLYTSILEERLGLAGETGCRGQGALRTL